MPHTATSDSSSIATTIAAFNRKLSISTKPAIHIELDNHYNSKVYTSSSPISGHVYIHAAKDTRFDSLFILLLGTTKTRVDGVHSPHYTSHTFLKLQMPIPEASYPVPRVYEAGRTYTIPFNFVIPSYLTISACNHNADSDAVHDHHLCLPPSLGSWSKDDFAPDMAHVEYAIKARVFLDHEEAGYKEKLMDASQKLQVMPSFMEESPLSIGKSDKLYSMTKSKSLRKSLLSSKIGKITASAAQPQAVMLSPDGRSISATETTVNLTFEPASSEASPPKITNIGAKVTAVTYYAGSGINTLPNLGDWSRNYGIEARGSYSGTTSLFSATVDKARWHGTITEQARRDSGYSSDVSDGGDHSGGRRRSKKSNRAAPAPVIYTTSLRVPIELPASKKQFVPTFHSCIASRVYLLWVTVTVAVNGSNTALTVGLPLQIGVEALASPFDDEAGLPSFEAAVEEAEADEHLRPRTLHVPEVHFERAELPGYA